jgi:hypothetical protein
VWWGAVKVTMTGDQHCKGVEIDPDLLKDADAEMLQDLILSGVNQALDESRKLAEQKMVRWRRLGWDGILSSRDGILPLPLQNLINALAPCRVLVRRPPHAGLLLIACPGRREPALSPGAAGLKGSHRTCKLCYNITTAGSDLCEICANDQRADGTICVVEDPMDVLAMERTVDLTADIMC